MRALPPGDMSLVAIAAQAMTAALRDILCNDVPLLFRSELYASVSVVTGLFYATAFGLKLNDETWTALTFVLGLSFRLRGGYRFA